ncbi:MAG: hypothetical protein NT167_23960 [Verrucomicrobia bacterium]|nr:hypothetical protein [Verrucomicrobiota bacterium]
MTESDNILTKRPALWVYVVAQLQPRLEKFERLMNHPNGGLK